MLDHVPTAEAALKWAIPLARDFNAELKLYQGIAHTPIGHPTLDKAVALEVAKVIAIVTKGKDVFHPLF